MSEKATTFPELHDVTLIGLSLDWASGTVVVSLLSEGPVPKDIQMECARTASVSCTRQLPWGRSVYVNKVQIAGGDGGAKKIEIEMQSGDVISIEAADAVMR